MKIDMAKAQKLLNDGLSAKQIAARFDVKAPAIHKHVRAGRLHLPPRGKIDKVAVFQLLLSGAKIKDIAAAVGCDKTYISQLRDSAAFDAFQKAAAKADAPTAPPPIAADNGQAPAGPDELPQGYIAGLIATKGKYLALEDWRKTFGPLIGRDIGAAKALQEWHKYRGAR